MLTRLRHWLHRSAPPPSLSPAPTPSYPNPDTPTSAPPAPLSELRAPDSDLRSPPAAPPIAIPAALLTPLDPHERAELRDWLRLPATQKALALVEARHPGLQTAGLVLACKSEWDERAAVAVLNRIRGFETYRHALLTIATPPAAKSDPTETYPTL